MRSIFIRVLAVFAALVLILAVIGTFLPRGYSVRAEVNIAAPDKIVFGLINELQQWERWSPWSPERIQDLKVTYGTPNMGSGASQSWTEPRGNGKLWITDSEPVNRVAYQMKFGDFPEMSSKFEIDAIDPSHCKVIWISNGELPGGPFYGYLGFIFESGMQFEYDQGLARLKEIAEEKAVRQASSG